jgi:hypothetical protein
VVVTDRALNHMSNRFQDTLRGTPATLKKVYRAPHAVVVPGSGTFAMEEASGRNRSRGAPDPHWRVQLSLDADPGDGADTGIRRRAECPSDQQPAPRAIRAGGAGRGGRDRPV